MAKHIIIVYLIIFINTLLHSSIYQITTEEKLKKIISINTIESGESTKEWSLFLYGILQLRAENEKYFHYIQTEYQNLSSLSMINKSDNVPSHIIIYGSMNTFGSGINISLSAMDNITKKNIVSINRTIDKDYYDNISSFASDFINLLKKKSADYSELFHEKILDYSENGNDIQKELAGYITSQERKLLYDNYTAGSSTYFFPIVYGKNNITIGDLNSDFTAVIDNLEFHSKDKILTLYFDQYEKNEAEITLYRSADNDKKFPYSITIPLEKISVFKFIRTYENRKIVSSKLYLDFLNTVTTSGYSGVELTAGFVLPPDSEIRHSVYIKTSFEFDAAGLISKNTDMPNMTLRAGTGYQYHLYIMRLLSINFGFEAGGEISFISNIIENRVNFNFNKYTAAFPAFYAGIPFTIEAYSGSNITFIAGFTPTFRLISKGVLYNSTIWAGNFQKENTDAGLFNPDIKIRKLSETDPTYSAGLFLYNMPVRIGVRIKL